MANQNDSVGQKPGEPGRRLLFAIISLTAVILVLGIGIGLLTRRAEVSSPKPAATVRRPPAQTAEGERSRLFLGLDDRVRESDTAVWAASEDWSREAQRFADDRESVPEFASASREMENVCRSEARNLRSIRIPAELYAREGIRGALNHFAESYECRAEAIHLLRMSLDDLETLPRDKIEKKLETAKEHMRSGVDEWIAAGKLNGVSGEELMERDRPE